MKIAAILIILLVVGFVGAGNYYVVSGKGQTALVPKAHFALTPIFVDVDNWSIIDLVANREIALQVIRAGKGGMLPGGGVIDALNAAGKIGAAAVDHVAREATDVVSKAGADAAQGVGQAVDNALQSNPDAQQVIQQGSDATSNAAAQAKAAIESEKAKDTLQKSKATLNRWRDKLHDAIQRH